MPYGYNSRFLRMDLGTGEVSTQTYTEELARKYLGGSGIITRILWDEVDLHADPLGPENPLAFMTGLLTGTPVPTACKGSVVARSPLTGLWSESTVGGYWPARLKGTGYDGILFTGEAPKPVYVYLDRDRTEVLPAGDLWGLDTYEVAERLREIHGDKCQVAAIGPAGENLVKIASIMMGGHDGRAAGRTGMGAVMGSKRLKAIVAGEGARPGVADLKALQAKNKEVLEVLKVAAKGLHDFGTAGGVKAVEAFGDLPIKNWMEGSWTEGAEKICGQTIDKTVLEGHYACFSCPIRCGKIVRLRTGPHQGDTAHGPEYETCAGLGSMVLNDDLDVLCAGNDLCNRLGLDTISASAVIALAMEAYDKGLISREDAGMEVLWGDPGAILGLLQQVAYRQGLGEVLSGGVKSASEQLGKNTAEMAVHQKGLEYAYHDPRAFTSMSVNYSTANRGACHLEGLTYFVENKAFPGSIIGLADEWDPHSSEGKAKLAVSMQDFLSVFNPLGICKFLMRGKTGPDTLAHWVNSALGWEVDAAGLIETGERLFNMHRAINTRMGISRKDDVPPPRLISHARRTGGAAGSLPHAGKLLNEYYDLRGWDEEGIPTEDKLLGLGLECMLPPTPW
ncbi:MAG: aldehyde ferredoxin oxidoreductase family protein [Bacillota bacterium]